MLITSGPPENVPNGGVPVCTWLMALADAENIKTATQRRVSVITMISKCRFNCLRLGMGQKNFLEA
jgi:hypothetical protein